MFRLFEPRENLLRNSVEVGYRIQAASAAEPGAAILIAWANSDLLPAPYLQFVSFSGPPPRQGVHGLFGSWGTRFGGTLPVCGLRPQAGTLAQGEVFLSVDHPGYVAMGAERGLAA